MSPLKYVVMALLGAAYALAANAQELYKYVDKDGKVTYSDVKPKPGEKATKVNVDHKDNVIASPKRKTDTEGDNKETRDRSKDAKASDQTKKANAIEAAEKRLADAKKALEEGREMTADDTIVRVGRNEKGGQSGANQVIPKPEYHERVAKLEEAVKAAEENLAKVKADVKADNAGK